MTERNLIDLLVSQRDATHVDTVIIDGEMRMQQGRLLSMDMQTVKEEALNSSRELWERNGFSAE